MAKRFVYVTVSRDPHSEDDVDVFSKQVDAISFAEHICDEQAKRYDTDWRAETAAADMTLESPLIFYASITEERSPEVYVYKCEVYDGWVNDEEEKA